ncbi:hypothetical protein PV04_02532 [Phialophora macrospora]|uniref:Uncharacterized protein n=1 Tax=Phialophora macrospora TaxID=1851006 RepID=A0A0D2GDM1_9EURO|nr:hypothetical protein PV04_02532 [Phialophora macrospora]
MASIIVGSAILIGYVVHERKEKKREKARLAEEQYSDVHGKPTVVSSRRLRKQQQVATPDLPSYESVVSGRPEFAAGWAGDQKTRRNSEESPRRV